MSFDYSYMMEEDVSELVGIFVSMIGQSVLSIGLSIAAYVLIGLGLYTIAQRRGIKHPWMAWVPMLKLWILGSIADQYCFVVKGEVRNRRKVLIVLSVVQLVAAIVIYALIFGMLMNFVVQIVQIPDIEAIPGGQALNMALKTVMPMLGMLLVLLAVNLVARVFQYIAYYDLFASCDPENKVLFLVLGILFSITLPFFVFACRKKDRGMPPRRVQRAVPVEPVAVEQPVYQEPETPVYQEPEEPKVDFEE